MVFFIGLYESDLIVHFSIVKIPFNIKWGGM